MTNNEAFHRVKHMYDIHQGVVIYKETPFSVTFTEEQVGRDFAIDESREMNAFRQGDAKILIFPMTIVAIDPSPWTSGFDVQLADDSDVIDDYQLKGPGDEGIQY